MLTLEESSPRLPDSGGVGESARPQSPIARSSVGGRWVTAYLLPLLVTLLAMSLHLYRLDSQSLWLDELGTLARAGWEGSWLDAIREPLSKAGDAKPPLPFLVTHLSLMLGEQMFVLRLPAALFATLTIPVVYALGKVLFAGQVLLPGHRWTRSAQVGLLGALLLALAPLHIRYAQEVRMYAMWVFLSTLSLYLFWRAIRSGAGHWWIAFALVTVLALYTHQFTLLTLAVMALFGLWLLASPSTRVQFPFRAWHFITAMAAPMLAYAPMVPFLAEGLVSSQGLVEEPVQSWDLAALLSTLRLFSGGYDIGTIVCVGLLGAAVVVLLVRGRAVLLLATMWIVVPVSLVLLLPFGHRRYVRYFLCALPVYLLLVAYGLLAVREWFASWLARRARVSAVRAEKLPRVVTLLMTATLAGILLTTSAASTASYYAETKQNWRDATRLLCSLAKPGERIYVRNWYYRIGVLYYARQGSSGLCSLAADDVHVLPRDLANAFPPGGDQGSWLVIPAYPKFLSGEGLWTKIQPHYRFLEPTIFPPSRVPKESGIISPLTFRGVAVVRVVPSERASIRFWSEEGELAPGDCTWLQWEVDDVREVYLQGEGVVGHDHRQVCPQTTTRYDLEVTHLDGTVTRHTVQIEVRGP
jgi:uncharacterized membrane protein